MLKMDKESGVSELSNSMVAWTLASSWKHISKMVQIIHYLQRDDSISRVCLAGTYLLKVKNKTLE